MNNSKKGAMTVAPKQRLKQVIKGTVYHFSASGKLKAVYSTTIKRPSARSCAKDDTLGLMPAQTKRGTGNEVR